MYTLERKEKNTPLLACCATDINDTLNCVACWGEMLLFF